MLCHPSSFLCLFPGAKLSGLSSVHFSGDLSLFFSYDQHFKILLCQCILPTEGSELCTEYAAIPEPSFDQRDVKRQTIGLSSYYPGLLKGDNRQIIWINLRSLENATKAKTIAAAPKVRNESITIGSIAAMILIVESANAPDSSPADTAHGFTKYGTVIHIHTARATRKTIMALPTHRQCLVIFARFSKYNDSNAVRLMISSLGRMPGIRRAKEARRNAHPFSRFTGCGFCVSFSCAWCAYPSINDEQFGPYLCVGAMRL
ncbi:MAG: hypothetical protein JW821_18165 [Deltaproteobacteria bacterium]|nr:hypothetical protein [Deltaproteobacteria bacterium]